MKAIGGYFELADFEEGVFLHKNGLLLNTGRNALEFILRSIGDVKRVFLPYYTCEAVLEPLKKLHIPWIFYRINLRFEIEDVIKPKEGEYIIANNYFGIKDTYIQTLADHFGEHLIVDCAQALFAKPVNGIKTFYSPRKFVGAADGGVAYIGNDTNTVNVCGIECTEDHDSHLLKRKELGAEAGFADYQENERKLNNQPIRWMSDTTKRILNHINYDNIANNRCINFQYLHEALADKNSLSLPRLDSFACPMVYPLVIRNNRNLRKKLIYNKVYVAKYWPNVNQPLYFGTEYKLSELVVPLPVDQRYDKDDMQRIVEIVLQ